MLFLLVLVVAFLYAAIIYVVGTCLAFLLWFVGRLFGLRLPAWLRWGAVACGFLLLGLTTGPELLSLDTTHAPSPTASQGFELIQFRFILGAKYLAMAALACTGVIASLLRSAATAVLPASTPPPLHLAPPPLPRSSPANPSYQPSAINHQLPTRPTR